MTASLDSFDPGATQSAHGLDPDVQEDADKILQEVELEEIRCEFLTLSDLMMCSQLWKAQSIRETLATAMKIVLQRREFLAEFEKTYRKEHSA